MSESKDTYIASLYEVKARLEELSEQYKTQRYLPNPGQWTQLSTSDFQAERLGSSLMASGAIDKKSEELQTFRKSTMNSLGEYVGGHRVIKPGSLLKLGLDKTNPLVYAHDQSYSLTVDTGTARATIQQGGKWDTDWGRTVVDRHGDLYFVDFKKHGPGQTRAVDGHTDCSDMSTDPEGFTKVIGTAVTAHDELIGALNGE